MNNAKIITKEVRFEDLTAEEIRETHYKVMSIIRNGGYFYSYILDRYNLKKPIMMLKSIEVLSFIPILNTDKVSIIFKVPEYIEDFDVVPRFNEKNLKSIDIIQRRQK